MSRFLLFCRNDHNLAAARSAAVSAAVSSRNAPGASVSSSTSGPMDSRFRYSTGAPRAASIRFTWWNFPSRSVTMHSPGPSSSSPAGSHSSPSPSVIPAAKAAASSGPSGPSTRA